MSDLSLDVNFEGNVIEVDAEFGYSNTRYVSPSEYTGELTVVPSHERHILETTGKMLNGNVTVEAAPTSEVIFTENGEYLPPEGEVGFRKVGVDVNPDLRPLSVSENGTYQPDGFDGYDSVVVDVPVKTLISESVLAVDKTSETIHENYWVENYLPAEQEADALYVIEFENNNAPNYIIEKMIVGGSRGSGLNGYTGCLIIRRDNGVDIRYVVNFQNYYVYQQRTCAASIGTVIKVYKLRYAF